MAPAETEVAKPESRESKPPEYSSPPSREPRARSETSVSSVTMSGMLCYVPAAPESGCSVDMTPKAQIDDAPLPEQVSFVPAKRPRSMPLIIPGIGEDPREAKWNATCGANPSLTIPGIGGPRGAQTPQGRHSINIPGVEHARDMTIPLQSLNRGFVSGRQILLANPHSLSGLFLGGRTDARLHGVCSIRNPRQLQVCECL